MDEATRATYARDMAKLNTSAFWKPKSGGNQIRLLPKPPEEADPQNQTCTTELRTHFNIGPDSKASLCNALAGQPCAICEFNESQIAAGAAETVEPMKPSTQFNFHIIDLTSFDAAAAEYMGQLWSASPAQTRDILAYLCDPEWSNNEKDVVDPHTGNVCVIDKTERAGAPNLFKIRFNPTPFPIDVNRVKYAKGRSYDSYEDQRAMLSGGLPFIPATSPQPAPTVQVAPIPAAVPVPIPAATPVPVPAAVPVPAQRVTSPPPTVAAPVALPPPPIQPEANYWVALPDNTTSKKPMSTTEVKAHMQQNKIAAATLQLMNQDQSGGWKSASEFGFTN